MIRVLERPFQALSVETVTPKRCAIPPRVSPRAIRYRPVPGSRKPPAVP